MSRPSSDSPVLVCCLLIDPPTRRCSRQLGKILGSTILRSFFGGHVAIWRNFAEPLFPVERRGFTEVKIDTGHQMDDVGAAIWVSQEWRIKIAIKISEKSSAYEWVLMCDADVVCLRNWDHLFEDVEGDLLVSRNSEKEIDAGFFAVRGSLFAEFAAEWARSFKSTRDIPNTRRDGRALNSLLENTSWQVKDFEKGEIVRLYDKNTSPSQVLSSAGVHIGGGTIDEKCQLAFGLHMMRTYGERDGIFLDLLES